MKEKKKASCLGTLIIGVAAFFAVTAGLSAFTDSTTKAPQGAYASEELTLKERKAKRKEMEDELKGTFYENVNHDVTGRWRMFVMYSNKTAVDIAKDYYSAYFESDDEIHFIVNLYLKTTTCVKCMVGQLFMDVYEYVEHEETSAKTLASGMSYGSAVVDPATGKETDIDALIEEGEKSLEAKDRTSLRAELDTRVNGAYGDPIGGRKTYYVHTDEPSTAFALDYYNAYFENDEENHYIINEDLGTSARIETLGDDDLFLAVNPYQGKDDAPGLGQFTISRKTGRVQDLSKPDPLPEEEEEKATPTKKMVKKAQKYLKKAGFYDGEATGELDKATKKAVKKYRKAAGLTVSTEVDDELIVSLKSENYGIPVEIG